MKQIKMSFCIQDTKAAYELFKTIILNEGQLMESMYHKLHNDLYTLFSQSQDWSTNVLT